MPLFTLGALILRILSEAAGKRCTSTREANKPAIISIYLYDYINSMQDACNSVLKFLFNIITDS